MPRITLEPAKSYSFSTEIQIYISHVNQGGHLDNAQLLTLVSEARARFFRWLGYNELDVEGCALVVGDIVAQYKSEGFHGEIMCVDMVPSDFNKYGFDIQFKMTEKLSGREVSLGKIGVVFIQPDPRKVSPIPTQFLERLTQLTETAD